LIESNVCKRVAVLTIQVTENGTANVSIQLLDRDESANGPNSNSGNGSFKDDVVARVRQVVTCSCCIIMIHPNRVVPGSV
jgi:hypothetical protein